MSTSLTPSEPLQPKNARITLAGESCRELPHLASRDRTLRVEATETEAGRMESFQQALVGVRLLLVGARHEALDELVRQAQELDFGY
nr:hypothetical protein [uncultured Rhodopila sp.]